ncbi:MAG: tRNA pseudouridine(38-40) synthase TruA, partial [Ruminococcaceae bacterium]|nr:tRNA pseudouridine(38-40) synthase TruA [Oscillospiraceae bacterium]
MRNIALKLMYNGTAYHGWQVQKNAVSVAETLLRALTMVCGSATRLTGCGRTDAGVHAEHYIANFYTDSRIPIDRLPFAVNTHTPEDIVVKEAYDVPEGFNAIGTSY